MSLPRPVIPGRTYLITRRCSERRFFLRPDHATNNNYLYCLAYAAQKAQVGVTATCAMSNHHHTGINDHLGTFPVFLEKFHGLLARCQNAQLGHHEAFWSAEATSVVWLVNREDVLDKLAYTFANPAAADLVDTIHDWPGVHSFQATLVGGTLTATRPKHFFLDEGNMPETITLQLERPIGFEAMADKDWSTLVKEKVLNVEAGHRARRRAEGKHVLGRRRVENQSPFDCPKSPAAPFQLSPKIAAKSKWARIEAIRRDMDFVQRHAKAVRATLDKVANVVFPFGTYLWRKLRHCLCEPAPSNSLDPPQDPIFA